MSRYIHLNPNAWEKYPYSSLGRYLTGRGEDWATPDKMLDLFASRAAYGEFVKDYKDIRDVYETIKHELVN